MTMGTGESKLILAAYGSTLRGACRETLASWWERQARLFRQLGLEMDHVSGAFRDKPDRMSDHTAYTYSRYRRRFERELSKGNVRYLSLAAMNTKLDGYVALDWDAECVLGECKGYRENYGVLSQVAIDVRHLAKLGDSLAEFLGASVLETTRSFIKTTYGFCTVMPRDFMPSGYVQGLMTARAPAMLTTEASEWMKWMWRECSRYLRNIHAVNVLSDSHLRLLVGQERLGGWIGARPERGELTELGEGLTLWSLAGDEKGAEALCWDAPRVQAVREELMKHTFFPWQKKS